MSDPYIGEIRIFAGSYAPLDWAFCEGQLLPIARNPKLFAVLGTTYGGDGRTNFALPDLRAATPLQAGQGPNLSNRPLGVGGGQAQVWLTAPQTPVHTHQVNASNTNGSTDGPLNAVWAVSEFQRIQQPLYRDTGPNAMSQVATSIVGGSNGHDNMMPYLPVNFIIALQGANPTAA